MSLRIMKLIDGLVGSLLCFLATLIARGFRHCSATYPKTAGKILVIKFLGIGSIVLLSPAIKRLKKKYPDAQITFLTFKCNAELLDMIPEVDKTLVIRSHVGILGFTLDTLRMLHYIRKQKFDLLIDCEFLTRFSALVTFLSNSKVAIGFHAWETYRGQLHNIRVPFNYYWHVTRNFINLATGESDSESGMDVPHLRLPENMNGWTQAFLKERGVAPTDFMIIVNPNAGELALERRWPRENFVCLLKALSQQQNAKLFLIGGKEDTAHTAGIAREAGLGSDAVLAGILSIPQLAALLSQADLLITNDSGPLHFAWAMNTPTISFFGPETPVIYGPIGDRHRVFFANIACSPCINVHNTKTVRCRHGHPECLAGIAPEEVESAVHALMMRNERQRTPARRVSRA